MSEPSPTHSAMLAELERVCRRVRRRVRLQRALDALCVWGSYAFGACALLILGSRLRWLELGDEGAWIAGASLVTLGAACLAASRALSLLEAAQRLDSQGALFDRLGSALAFSRLAVRSAHQEAAMSDAARFIDHVSPSQAAPLALPRRSPYLLAVLLTLAFSSWIVVPAAPIEAKSLPPLAHVQERARVKTRLNERDKERLEAQAAALEVEASHTQDPRVAAWISDLNELLKALHAGQVTPTQAHSALARLERARDALDAEIGQDAEALAAHAQKAAKRTRTSKKRALSETLQALRDAHWREAAESMERLAARLERGELSRRARKGLAKDMAQLAKRLETERQKERRRVKAQRDRLKRKQAKQKERFSKRNRDRLKRQERRLKRLERQRESSGEMRRQLERLQRGLDASAERMLKRLAEQQERMSAEELRQAAELLRRMSKSAKGRRQMRSASRRMIDLKELLRRARRAGARGQGGQGGEGSAMERFLARAKGGASKGAGSGQEGGKGSKERFLVGDKTQTSAELVMPGNAARGSSGQGGEGLGQGGEGEGVGHGHNPNLLGERSDTAVKTFESSVSGRMGEGDSKSRVVFSAAKKGFSSQAWGKVHQDYRDVVEDALEEQAIPRSKRRYVRRYFELIRPR